MMRPTPMAITLIPIPNRLLSIELDAIADMKVLDSDIDFEKMGIGGLDKQAEDLFRRTMTTRNMDQKLLSELGQTHTKGVLLYGPPGTGKTLIARQLAKVLRSNKPVIVNGPELINKYVGQSEENIRELFAAAEADQERLGARSQLHTIIIDEADALFKQRGRGDSVSGHVNDGMVNQFLSKLDGVHALNNILVFLLTNRRELIDDAVLRPGRIEVHLEISLPDAVGRKQIFEIHLAQLKKTKHLAEINLDLIVANTVNFSGAEIAGVVRSAVSFAAYKSNTVIVTDEHLLRAIKEIIPLYGSDQVNLKRFLTFGFIEWGARLTSFMNSLNGTIRTFFTSEKSMTRTIVIRGGRFTGKTSIAIQIATGLNIPYVKLLSMNNYLGSSELSISSMLKYEFIKASKSNNSCIIINDYEHFGRYGVLHQAIELLIGEIYQNKVLIIITSTESVDFVPVNFIFEVPLVETSVEAKNIIGEDYELVAPIGIKELISLHELI
jgi:vesicle-fusing ATPase